MTSFWYCDNCHEEILPENVTYQENHDRCGHPVRWVELDNEAKEQELPTAGQIQLLKVFSLFCDGRHCARDECSLYIECEGSMAVILEKLTK